MMCLFTVVLATLQLPRYVVCRRYVCVLVWNSVQPAAYKLLMLLLIQERKRAEQAESALQHSRSELLEERKCTAEADQAAQVQYAV